MNTPIKMRRSGARPPLIRVTPALTLAVTTYLLACEGTGPAPSVEGGSPEAATSFESSAPRTEQAAGTSNDAVVRPFRCKDSKAQIFQQQEPINIRITADFTALNRDLTPDEQTSEFKKTELDATIELLDQPGVEPLKSKIAARGYSRFEHCAFRPFSLKRLKELNRPEDPDYLKSTLLGRLGNSVKIVTHCGTRQGDEDPKYVAEIGVHEQRLRMEHSVYQVLDQLDILSLKTRLVNLTYRDTQRPGQDQTYVAFVREPEDQMAERCGMVEQEDGAKVGPWPSLPNPYSDMLLQLSNAFVIQNDWSYSSRRNTIELADAPNMRELFYAPYDFDLVGIFRPDYGKNANRSLITNMELFADWLRRNQSSELFGETSLLLGQYEAMSHAFDQAGLNTDNSQTFHEWLNASRTVLQQFQSCKGLTRDQSRPDCWVQDDHGDDVTSATPVDGVSWSTVIEPAHDVDVFRIQPIGGALLTLAGQADLELIDANGTHLASQSSGQQTSFSRPLPETVYVRATLENQLVTSPMHSPASNRWICLYADDYGAAVDSAGVLTGMRQVRGKFEPEFCRDEDWLLLDVTSASVLRVSIDGQGEGIVEVRRRDALDQNPAAIEYLRPNGDSPVNIPLEPGEYVVKIVQDSSSAVSYLVEME